MVVADATSVGTPSSILFPALEVRLGSGRREHHDDIAVSILRRALDSMLANARHEGFQYSTTFVAVTALASTETNDHLHLVAIVEKLARATGLHCEIAIAGYGAKLDLLGIDAHLALAASRVTLRLGPLVAMPIKVYDAAHRHVAGSHEQQIESRRVGTTESFLQRDDADLASFGIDQTDCCRADTLVRDDVLGHGMKEVRIAPLRMKAGVGEEWGWFRYAASHRY